MRIDECSPAIQRQEASLSSATSSVASSATMRMVETPAAAAALDHAAGQGDGKTQKYQRNKKTTHGDSRRLGNRPSDMECRNPERAIQASARMKPRMALTIGQPDAFNWLKSDGAVPPPPLRGTSPRSARGRKV